MSFPKNSHFVCLFRKNADGSSGAQVLIIYIKYSKFNYISINIKKVIESTYILLKSNSNIFLRIKLAGLLVNFVTAEIRLSL